MGKKGGRNVKKIKPKAMISSLDLEKLEEAALGLTLGPMKLVAKSPFNAVLDPVEAVILTSKDNVEFFLPKSLLAIASPFFKKILMSSDEPSEKKEQGKPKRYSALDWDALGDYLVLDFDEDSTNLDAILRFVYPTPDPVFKESVQEKSVEVLPFRLMGPIHDAAQRYEFSYVCRRILEVAHDIIFTRSLPESGHFAVRAYGVACRLELDDDARLRAARNALCVPLGPTVSNGLVGEGISEADTERFADFHKRAHQAVQDLLRINDEDAYPVGLSDIHANFVACTYCCGISPGGNVMRCGAARWWQFYCTIALERLRYAPLDPSIFFENFMVPVFREAQKCHACASLVHWKWCNMMPMLAQTIPGRIYEVRLSDKAEDEQTAESGESEEEEEEKCNRSY